MASRPDMAATRKSRADVTSARRTAEDTLAMLKEDPARLRVLLRNASALVEEIALAVSDAGHEDESAKMRLLAKSLRGAALLPVALAIPLLRKGLDKVLAASG